MARVQLSMLTRLLALAAVVAPSLAHADVTFAKGGPTGAAVGLAEGALGEAQQAMAVCWRAPTTGPVRVKLAVAAGGEVTAQAVTKGAAAQCAAGILAVWTIPGGPWKGEVDIGSGAAAAPALSQQIQTQLVAASAPIKACQDRAPGKAGLVAIKMRIAPDGTIGDVAVQSKLGDAVATCVTRAVAAIKLRPTGAAGAVNYQLALNFAGGPSQGPSSSPPGDGGGGGGDVAEAPPTVDGTRDRGEILAAIRGLRAGIATCVGKTAIKGKRLTVRFTIRPDGTVKNIVIKESSGEAKLDGCVTRGLGALKLGAASDETKIGLPLAF